MIYKVSDIADIINVSVKDPSNCGIDIFVGLEHYDVGEPVITRHGSTEMLTTAVKKFNCGDILLARRNVYLRRAGKVDFDGVTSGDSIVIRVKSDLSKLEECDSAIMKSLLPFILNTNAFWDYANTNSDGTMSKRLSPQMLLEYEFDLPPLAEQKVLAEKLWAAYRLKESYKKLLAATEEMVKSQFIEMIESKDWPQVQLKDIVQEGCPISYGIVQPGDDIEGGVPIVRPVNMNETHLIDKTTLKHTSKEISDLYSRTILRGDEILVCVRGTTGLIALADGLKGCNVTRGITPLYFKPQYNREYLFRAFLGKQVQDFIQAYTIGSTLKGINMSKLRELPISIPPMDIQNQFVSIAHQADKSEYELRKSIDAIDAVIKSLINS